MYGVGPSVQISAEGGNITMPITIEDSTDYYTYISPVPGLGLGTLLVPTDPQEPHILLSEEHIRELQGIYLVRLGVAEFRVINLGENGVSTGYILLDPALNPGINEFANIVTDATTVVDGQLVR